MNGSVGAAMDRPLVSMTDDEEDWEERLKHPDPNAEELFAQRQLRHSVDEQLQALSNIERTILVLYHQEERTYEQIALSLNLPIGTVRTHLHRGRKKLREAIQEQQQAKPEQAQSMEGRTAWQTIR